MRALLLFSVIGSGYFLLADQIWGLPSWVGAATALWHFTIACAVYLRNGGPSITALGFFSIASALFLALPRFFLWYEVEPKDTTATFIACFCFALTALLSSRTAPAALPIRRQAEIVAWARPILWLIICVALMALAFTLKGMPAVVARASGPSLIAAFTIAATISTISYATGRRGWLLLPFVCVALLSFYFYYTYFFFESGRLRVILFGSIGAVLVSTLARPKLLKPASLAALPPLLYWSGSTGMADYSLEHLIRAKNLGSMISPFVTMSDVTAKWAIWTEQGLTHWYWGTSYLNVFLNYIPRNVWPDKPEGLGRVYTYLIRPDLVHTGHTLSGSYVGEIWVNFGWAGLIIGPVLISRALIAIESMKTRVLSGNPETAFIFLVFYALLSAGLADFVWSDSNTYTHRALNTAIVILFAIAPVVMSARQKRRSLKILSP